MATEACILRVDSIARRTEAATWLLRDVSLKVNHGDRIAVSGPSGSGKTLLLRSLAMLDPLEHGAVYWKGQHVQGDLVPEYRSRVIYLQQRPALVEGTVEDNLRAPFEWLQNRVRIYDRPKVLQTLTALGRSEAFLRKQRRDLSGGESSIVALVRAIQFDPSVLLLDEPTAALDSETAHQVECLISSWLNTIGFHACLWVSHDERQLNRISNRVIRVQGGRVE